MADAATTTNAAELKPSLFDAAAPTLPSPARGRGKEQSRGGGGGGRGRGRGRGRGSGSGGKSGGDGWQNALFSYIRYEAHTLRSTQRVVVSFMCCVCGRVCVCSNPEQHSDVVVLSEPSTTPLAVTIIRDAFPKARHHYLVLPRDEALLSYVPSLSLSLCSANL